MIENAANILAAIAAIAGVYHTIRIYRQAQRDHPVIHYDQHSSPNLANWRWRKPDDELGLKLEDDENKSCLHLPLRLLSFEKWCNIAGYLFALLVVYFFALLFMRHADLFEYFLVFIFVFLSLALLNVGSRVGSIVLYRDRMVFTENYALFLKRKFVYQHHPHLTFKGAPQSVFELTIDHTEPDFKLYIKRPYFFVLSTKRRLLLPVNQSQGSWLVEGLEYWRDHVH